ncbi:uncharacterized protein LOC122261371 isoform X2 [Penaeus japonicus]|uniref:uncharacterized protein LOC122261371 isoform X2 n=1 Tax=Penaeus japonicus TaxID=27405 RepID=UPI001C70B715|nr:uncharacterized protein LOC122261371 isoform X2 [Penaeus japonicus]
MASGRNLVRSLAGSWILLLLLQFSVLSEGRIYVKKRIGEIATFREEMLEVCIKPISPKPRIDVRLKLMNRGSAKVVSVGGVSLRKNVLSSDVLHTVSLKHFVDMGEHRMAVWLDGTYIQYVKNQVYAPSEDYVFHGFGILLRGRANITKCNVTPKSTTTTTTTTTTTPRPTTTTTTTTPPPTKAKETILFRKIENNELHQDMAEGGEGDDLTSEAGSGEGFPSVEAGTESTIHANATAENEEWWSFVWLMGDFRGVPVLLLLVVTLIIGLGIGALCTLCCEMYFNKRKDVDKGHEVDRKFSNYTSFRTEYYPRLSTTTTLTSTLNNARVDNEANHNNPLSQCPPPSPPCSSPADTYSMPHDAHRERAASVSVHDETLPLNYPLTYPDRDPQNSKLLHTFGGQSYRESEYQ